MRTCFFPVFSFMSLICIIISHIFYTYGIITGTNTVSRQQALNLDFQYGHFGFYISFLFHFLDIFNLFVLV